MQKKQEIKGMRQKLNEMHGKEEGKRGCPARERRVPAARKCDMLYPHKNIQIKRVIKTAENEKEPEKRKYDTVNMS